MEKYKGLRQKYDVTVEEIEHAIDELCKHGISGSCCDAMALIAVVDLMTNGDIACKFREDDDEE